MVGASSLYRADRANRPYAAIPLIFAAQQVAEGVLWQGGATGPYADALSFGFLFVASVIWPAYVPFAVYRLEPENKRARIVPFIVLGIALSAYLLLIISTHPLEVAVGPRHISYLVEIPWYLLVGALYVIATCGVLIASSFRWVRIGGFATALALVAAYGVTQTAVGSVWCFFAAILSSLVLLHVSKSRPQPVRASL